jgi:CHAT domain-containing protein
LVAPLTEYLPSASSGQGTTPHLAIVPHDVLHYLPFAALTDGQRYLMDDYVLTTLPSASVLPFIQENTGRALADPLVLGNPVTGDFDATASFATERDGLGSLPFAEKEAEAVAALYGVEPLLGQDAAEGAVRERGAGAGILHLAAHGHYNPVAPLSSLIALAPDDEYDGWLTVGEVYGLDLSSADLVVLSACQTNLGELSEGDELVGLTRAFIFAGTPSVVASLWSVEDEATALLMERFYTHLRDGMGKAEALRQAQLEVREEHPNPYYWAGFVLSGDPGEMSGYKPPGQETAPPLPPAEATTVPAEEAAKAKETPAPAKGGGGPCPAGALILALGVGVAFITNRRILP